MEQLNLLQVEQAPAEFPEGTAVAVLTAEGLDRFLDYRAPEGGVSAGDFVAVPLGPRRVLGVVWGPGQGGFEPAKLRDIARRLEVTPMRAEMRDFLTRAADYTLTPLTLMLRLASRAPGLGEPPSARPLLRLAEKAPGRMTDARARVLAAFEEFGNLGFAPGELARLAGVSAGVVTGLERAGVIRREIVTRDAPFPRLDPAAPARDLSPAQAAASARLRAAVARRAYSTTLLKGVTGSGKTEVYLEAVAEALAAGRQALVMLPEIALSVEFLDRVEARFGARPVEWHSAVTQVNRRRAWTAVAEGRAQLVVGARSALFLPYADLGLIVVDEEHDGSYKQEEGVLYHARDMAVLRASIEKAAVVLASATPALETWANADTGKYARIELPERFGVARLPEMAAIDLRVHAPESGHFISDPLAAAVTERLAAGEQALLFLNRRGYAPLTICRACGHQVGCDTCDARMVEHRFRGRLVCHQCGATRPIPTTCPSCGVEGKMTALGPGVERIAEEAELLWPEARRAILSSDLAEGPTGLKARIDEIAGGGADLVIGTQIVSKGHNFPHLTLVGVIDADLGLQGGDLRAAEKTFQLIRQVAGRAGRAERPGQALIQTYLPDHPAIEAILRNDDEGFWRAEAEQRRAAGAPPYGRMAGIIVTGPDETRAWAVARELGRTSGALRDIGAEVYGPAPAPIARIRGRWRARLLVRAPKGIAIQPAIHAWIAGVPIPANVRVAVDIDPQSFF
ncbi:MAG: primosomal protein N' [Rhodovulum sulfidophilum]|uniref:Replication restart protein PriA n=1 Tax=Rhodovulum sulfidophilum TaxID=35806 RepID=A0A2W5N3D8_RHOSU|nr:MAG: primosomal protein N' [Rhodovulum sulfidophilum]